MALPTHLNFLPMHEILDRRTLCSVNFICPARLIESDVKFNTETIKAEQPDSDGLLLVVQQNYRELIGQNVIDVYQSIWRLLRQRDALSEVSSSDFYAQASKSFCLSDLFPGREVLNIIGVESSSEELVFYAFTIDIEANEKQEQEWENKHGTLLGFEPKEDIILEKIAVSYSDKVFTLKGDKVSRKISFPESAELLQLSYEELQLWLENFLIKDRLSCTA